MEDSFGILNDTTWNAVDTLERVYEKGPRQIRIGSIDDEEQMLTMDYVQGRVTLSIKEDKVVGYIYEH